MIDAAERHDVRLMTAYRLHFERANLAADDLVRSGRLGDVRYFASAFSMQVKRGNIRLDARLGGGPLHDLGIYSINAARAVLGDEPIEVVAATATGDDDRFSQVEEMVSAVLRFPGDRLASITTSFGAADVGWYQVVGTRGSLRVDPAFEWAGRLEHHLTVDGRTTRREYPRRDQFGPELVYFSDCVLEGRDPEPSGREGLADVRVIEAIRRAAETGRSVPLPPFRRRRRPSLEQEIFRQRREIPDLVRADSPTDDD
jgi:glucose-fructose oxidoreductase